MFTFTPLRLPGLLHVAPDIHHDTRGFFAETYRRNEYCAQGIPEFVQDNHSRSIQRVVRGLKFQYDAPTAKLVRVAFGSVFAVAVDIRPGSDTFAQWEGITLSSENQWQIFVPFGYAFGFCVTSEAADVMYKLSAVHQDAGGGTIRWNDPLIHIEWPVADPILSQTDRTAPLLSAWQDSNEAALFSDALHACGSKG